MPQPGHYFMKKIDKSEFIEIIQETVKDPETDLKHYIGYKSTLTLIEHLTKMNMGILNRDKTELTDGDKLLIIRLKYRATPDQKRLDNPNISDFEFFRAAYKEDTNE